MLALILNTILNIQPHEVHSHKSKTFCIPSVLTESVSIIIIWFVHLVVAVGLINKEFVCQNNKIKIHLKLNQLH